MIEARDNGLLATTLHYKYEVRDEKPYFESVPNVKLSKEMLDLAAHIIDTKRGKFDPSKFDDRYQESLVDLIRAKRAGKPMPAAPQPKTPSNVINLMEPCGAASMLNPVGVQGAKRPRRRMPRPRRRCLRSPRQSGV